jgi:hypothetical protein
MFELPSVKRTLYVCLHMMIGTPILEVYCLEIRELHYIVTGAEVKNGDE